MKKIILCISIFLFTSLAYSETVRFATGEWAPFTSEKMKNYGYSTELVSAICKEAGITPIYDFYPWARTEHLVEQGQYFAAFPYAETEERKNKFNFSDTLSYDVGVYMYYLTNKNITEKIKNAKTLVEMKSLKFGCILGSYEKEDLKKNSMNFIEVADLDQLIKMLEAGRVDIVIANKTALYYSINNTFYEQLKYFKILDTAYGQKVNDYLLVSRSYPNSDTLLKKFNNALKSIKKRVFMIKLLKKIEWVEFKKIKNKKGNFYF